LRDFIQKNYTPYEGTEEFLAGPTEATKALWSQVSDLMKEEREKGGVLDCETKIPTSLTAYGAAYIDKDKETIVGLQTDKPLKRAFMPNGGIRTAVQAAKSYGYEVDPATIEIFNKYRKTHNTAVFDVYTPEMKKARHNHIVTGLPDAYGRGRIIGDYRRVALYGIDYLVADKQNQLDSLNHNTMTEETLRLREELAEQKRALKGLAEMAAEYGFDITKPAKDVKEAIQWTYFGYLGAVKEQNGAAMSLGRTSTFLDIYAERDLKNGTYTEEQIQEFIDHFIMKLRMVRFARIPEYNALFAGDPTWVTESLGGMGIDGRTLVTKMSFRYLHTLDNLGTAPEPNMTVLWSTRLPENWKMYCAEMSIKTSSFQYENDDLMRVTHGDDYAIACCVSSMRVGKEMQFFGARANLAKCLLYAINGGVDEKTFEQVGPKYQPITSEYLDFDEVWAKYMDMMEWLAGLYVETLNAIHWSHDKYCYEAVQMALHDRDVKRWFATGIAGLSVVADSLSAIKYAKVKVLRNEDGIAVDYDVEGDFPKYGNNDDRVDDLAVEVVERFMNMVRSHQTYRNSIPTTSILTITSNVSYGKNTGSTPDGRKAGVPLAPGANPMHGRDSHGALASLSSVSKLPFADAQDGISNTFTILPDALGKEVASVSLDDIKLTPEQIAELNK
jgi:formate C-acetyltransferase